MEYCVPKLEVVLFDFEDVVRTSNGLADGGTGSGSSSGIGGLLPGEGGGNLT